MNWLSDFNRRNAQLGSYPYEPSEANEPDVFMSFEAVGTKGERLFWRDVPGWGNIYTLRVTRSMQVRDFYGYPIGYRCELPPMIGKFIMPGDTLNITLTPNVNVDFLPVT